MNAQEQFTKSYVDRINPLLGSISMTNEARSTIKGFIENALNLIPKEDTEKKPIDEKKVVCKLFLKAAPSCIVSTLESITEELDEGLNYTATILIEEL